MSISVVNLSKSFDGKKVLDRFSCELPDRGVAVIMGRSGAGKSTLLNLLLGLLSPDQGEIRGLEGRDISAVFQEDRLLEQLDARENLRLTTRQSLERIDGALRALSLNPEDRTPVADYSGGMKRRVALARGVLYPADILLLDEPFRGLDGQTRAEAIAYLREGWRDRLMVLVTHDRQEGLELGGQTWIYIGGEQNEP